MSTSYSRTYLNPSTMLAGWQDRYGELDAKQAKAFLARSELTYLRSVPAFRVWKAMDVHQRLSVIEIHVATAMVHTNPNVWKCGCRRRGRGLDPTPPEDSPPL